MLLAVACREPSGGGAGLTAADSTAIRAVQAAYVRSWLADDTLGVLATLSPGAVLMPPGQEPVVGHAAIRAYWWPDDGSRTTIQRFEWPVEEIEGESGLAYTRGYSTLDWVYEKDSARQESTVRSANLTLLRRLDGEWKITHQIWGPAIK
jgi:ketosteroid isomerase-like protein